MNCWAIEIDNNCNVNYNGRTALLCAHNGDEPKVGDLAVAREKYRTQYVYIIESLLKDKSVRVFINEGQDESEAVETTRWYADLKSYCNLDAIEGVDLSKRLSRADGYDLLLNTYMWCNVYEFYDLISRGARVVGAQFGILGYGSWREALADYFENYLPECIKYEVGKDDLPPCKRNIIIIPDEIYIPPGRTKYQGENIAVAVALIERKSVAMSKNGYAHWEAIARVVFNERLPEILSDFNGCFGYYEEEQRLTKYYLKLLRMIVCDACIDEDRGDCVEIVLPNNEYCDIFKRCFPLLDPYGELEHLVKFTPAK